MRDFQRKRVYEALNSLNFGDEKFKSEQEIVDYVNLITSSRWYKNRFKKWKTIKVRTCKKRSFAFGCNEGGYIELPKSMWTRYYVLHEVSHVCQRLGHEGHGPDFCKIFITFVRRWFGRKEANQVRIAFKKHGVQFLSPETKI